MSNKNMYEILNQVTAELTSETSLFALTKTEVNGIEVKSFALAPPTLRDVWSLTEPHADKNYIIYEDERWLYKDAHAEVASIGKTEEQLKELNRKYKVGKFSFMAKCIIGKKTV